MQQQKIFFFIILLLFVGGVAVWILQPIEPPATTVSQPSKPTPEAPATVKSKSTSQPSAEAMLLRFTPQSGETLALQFDMTSNSQIDFTFITPAISGASNAVPQAQQSEKTPINMTATGELYLKYYPAESVAVENQWQVAARFANLDYRLKNQTPSYVEALNEPFTLQMQDTGFLSQFRFGKGVPKEAEQFTQQLLYSLQTAFSEQAKTAWHTKELDMNGRYRASYTLTSSDTEQATVVKQKTEYFTLNAAEHEINPMLSRAQMDISLSQATITLPLNGAWLLSLELEEHTRSQADGYVWADNHSRLTAQRIQRDLSGVFPATLTEFLAQLNAGGYLKSKYYLTDPELDRLGAKLTLDAALTLFDQLKNSDVANAARNAEKFLVNYLRQHPQAAFELVDAMDADPRRERFDQSTHLVLWRLLTEAGHAEAQQAIIGALRDPSRSHVTHMRALAYISAFEYPDIATVQNLWEFHQDLGTPQDKTAREFKTMSLFALGSLGAANKLNDNVKPDIAQMLDESLQYATEPREQAVALGAVSNYGGAEMLESIEPYFQAEHEQVRAAAYDALRRMDDPRALETLATHYATETSPVVRAAATQTLAKMPPSSASIAWAGQTVLNSAAPKEQIPLVQVLGKNLQDYPDSKGQLQALLQQNPDNAVKREIYKYIVPGQ